MKRILIRHCFYKLIGVILTILCVFQSAQAQYFGQNKVRYKKMNFKVYETPHFRIHNYLNNDTIIDRFAKEAEVWYGMHQQVFQDTFLRKNPVILYNNAPEFQQTTAISGDISVGTGGVTEAFKQRVVMPMMQINQQTRHVFGHELVHAFQYRILIERNDSLRLENIQNLPLWMVEGMAEYFSIGKKDAFTSMWMRDAYLNNDIPSLKAMTESNRYFPYRFGQSFWSYVGSTYGDTVIMPLFVETAKHGYELAMKKVFGYDAQTMSNLWKQSLINAYKNIPVDTAQKPIGRILINNQNGGEINVAPAISPDGKFLAFLSSKDLFSIDLFLADAKTGKIIRKLTSKLKNSDIDEFSYIESAGSFSPDSKKFAFSVFSRGKNKLMIVNTSTGKEELLEEMGDIVEFTNLSWGPDGNQIAFSGLRDGQSDLYLFNLVTKKVTPLTNDLYSDYQPSFSRDGKQLVFSTDRMSFHSSNKSAEIPMGIATIDLATLQITNLNVFPGANNLNPQFASDDKTIYFLSNRDGFRNLYQTDPNTLKTQQLTNYFTGISGITEYSPALSISNQDDIVYSYFKNSRYTVYLAKSDDFKGEEVRTDHVNFDAAMLPPPASYGVDLVNQNLNNFNVFTKIPSDDIKRVPYKPQFKLDYLANTGVGVSVGSRYGAGVAGGIQGIFSDLLGENQIFANLSVNGEIYDFGGQFAYINQKNRINWGGAISHIPFMSGFSAYGQHDFGMGTEPTMDTYIIRTFQDQVEAFAAYPFNRYHRFEMGAALAHYSFRVDKWSTGYYSGYTDRFKVSSADASQLGFGNMQKFTTQQINMGFVGDHSVFGITAPLEGFRYRFGVEQYFGDYSLRAWNVDVRKYIRLKPVTIAARAYTYMREGKDADKLYRLYLGYPYFVRGYENAGYSGAGTSKVSISDLMGSRIAVGNFEIRLPFTGPEKLAAIKSGFLFTDLNFFVDAGLAWSKGNTIKFSKGTEDLLVGQDQAGGSYTYYDPNVRVPIFSAGISVRVNLFGTMILEPYYAIPFQRTDVKFGTFGLNFTPGW